MKLQQLDKNLKVIATYPTVYAAVKASNNLFHESHLAVAARSDFKSTHKGFYWRFSDVETVYVFQVIDQETNSILRTFVYTTLKLSRDALGRDDTGWKLTESFDNHWIYLNDDKAIRGELTAVEVNTKEIR